MIRDFNDSDGNQVILEAYRGVNMVPGNSKYIGLKIGTLNGDYERKSKYVVVEVIENETTETYAVQLRVEVTIDRSSG